MSVINLFPVTKPNHILHMYLAARRAEANEMRARHASMLSGRNIRRSGLKWPVERHCDVLTFISIPNNDQCLFLEKNNGSLFLFFMTGLVGKTGMFLLI